MISVKPLEDENKVKQLFDENNVSYGENCGCVTAMDGDEVLGFCLYTFSDDAVTVHSVEPAAMLPLADGILRSALHVASNRFKFKAFYDNTDYEPLYEKLDFIKDKNEHLLDIDKLFRGCACHKN